MAHPATLFPLRSPSKQKTPLEQQIADAGLPEPEQEYRFAPPRNWRFDFCWQLQRIALEVEGGAFGRYIVITNGYERRKGQSIPIKPGTVIRVGGRHNTGSGMEADCDKYSWAAILGWCVVRATTTMVRDGKAIELLRQAFRQRNGESA